MKLNNKGFSKLEGITIIFIISIVLLIGIVLVVSLTKNKKVNTFKSDVISIMEVTKNVYDNLEKNNSEYIANSESGDTKAVCITLNGLIKNDYLENDYSSWDGYIVQEKDENNKITYIAWLSNGKYMIDGYSLDTLKDLDIKEIPTFEKNYIEPPASTYKGTSKEKGGQDELTIYNSICIDEKIE